MTEEPPVPLDKIESAPTEPVTGSLSGKNEQAMFAHEREKFKKELGWLGLPFGGRSEKPGNISALVVVLCFIGLGIIYARPPTSESGVTLDRLFGGLTSIITLVLGYLFGSNDRASK